MRENFAVFSSISIVCGLALSTLFLSAYLTVFDWHLIWFVQYADIITFGLIAVGVTGGSFLFIFQLSQTVLGMKVFKGERAWKGPSIFIGFWVLIYCIQMYFEHRQSEPHYQFVTAAWLSVIAALSFVVTISIYARSGLWPNAGQIIGIAISVVMGTLSFGQWLGMSILYSSQFNQDVFAKNEVIQDAKLIALMSRSTIVMKDKMIYVFPTNDIVKLQTAMHQSAAH